MNAPLAVGDLMVDVSVRRPHERMEGATEFVPIVRLPAIRAIAVPLGVTGLSLTIQALVPGWQADPAGGPVHLLLVQLPKAPEET